MIAEQLDRFPELTRRTLDELGLGKQCSVVAIRPHDTYWTAFKIMSQKVCAVVGTPQCYSLRVVLV